MAVIRDVMPAFELFQPASMDAALALLDRHGVERLGARRRPRQLRLAEGPHQAPERRRRSERDRRAERHPRARRRPRDRRDDDAHRGRAASGRQGAVLASC